MSVLPWFLSCVFSVIQGNSISSAREVFSGSVSLEKLFLQCPMFLHSLSFLRESMLVLVNERQDNTKLSLKAQCTLCGRVKPVAFPCISRASLARQLQVSLSFTSVWTKAQKSTGWEWGWVATPWEEEHYSRKDSPALNLDCQAWWNYKMSGKFLCPCIMQ